MKFIYLATLCALLGAGAGSGSARAALTLKNSGKDTNFLYEEDHKALASTVQFVFRTGSLSDPVGKEGLANLAYESLLRGTKAKERKEFFAAVERLGATITSDTGSGRTILTLSAISENLEAAIQLLAEAVLQPSLKDAEIESMKQEELSQMGQELANNREVLKRVARQVIFRGTPLAIPANGTTTSLAAIKPADARSFLAAHLKSGNVVVAVTSNLPETKVKPWIEAAFAGLPDGAAPLAPKLEFFPIKGRQLYLVERAGSATTEVALAERGIEAGDKDRVALEAGLFLFGGDMSSRLFEELRNKTGWTYGVTSTYQLIDIPRRDNGSFLLYAFPKAEHTKELTLRALELYEEYVQKGLTAKELEFARLSLGNAYPFRFATSRSKVTARLYEFLEGAPMLSVPEYRKELRAMTPASFLRAVQKAHDPENLAIVIVGNPEDLEPLKKSIPDLAGVTMVTDPQKVF